MISTIESRPPWLQQQVLAHRSRLPRFHGVQPQILAPRPLLLGHFMVCSGSSHINRECLSTVVQGLIHQERKYSQASAVKMAPPITSKYDWILALTTIAFVVSAFGNGANDVAN